MPEPTDDQILERAKAIQSERGGSLTDAMISAEEQLRPKPKLPEAFTVTIPVKARVARWVMAEFEPVGDFSTEDRLGAWLAGELGRARIRAMRAAEDAPDIGQGGAVTMTRHKFQEKAAKE